MAARRPDAGGAGHRSLRGGPGRPLWSSAPLALLAAAAGSPALFLGAAATALGSCPAGEPGAACRQAAGPAPGRGSAPAAAPQQDVIEQELEELGALLRLAEERIAVLEQLRRALAEGSHPGLSASQARALQAELPLLSELPADPARLPTAAAEDYLTSRAVVRLEGPARLIKFLPLRAAKSKPPQDTLLAPLPALLVAARADGKVELLAPSGERLLTFATGHERPVSVLAVSPSWAQGDTLIATGDLGGIIRVHRVLVKQKRAEASRSEDTVSSENDTRYLGTSVGSCTNVTVQFQRQLEALSGSDGEVSKMTSLAMCSQQGSKYFVVGDAEGKISVFTLAGVFRARMDATLTPGTGIEGFYVHLSQLLFRAGHEWGYIDLEKLEVKHVECPDFEGGRVTAAIIDSQQSWKVLVADEEGSVWVLAVRHARSCRVEHKFPRGLTKARLELASVRGFVLALERASGEPEGHAATLMALNMSHASRPESELRLARSPVVWRRARPRVRAWAVYRHRQEAPSSDLLAFLSEDGSEVEIMELLMPLNILPPISLLESLLLNAYIILPVIIILVLVVVGWHYVKYGRASNSKAK